MGAESTGISATVALTGLLPFVVLMAAALSFPLCFLLLRLYRKSVLKGMDTSAGGQAAEPVPAARLGVRPAALSIRELSEATSAGAAMSGGDILREAANGPWQTAAVYAMAGSAYAAVMTAAWLVATKDSAIVWTKIALLFWTYFWPAVIAVLLVAAYDRSRRLQLLAGYFGALAVLIAVALARNPNMSAGELPFYWLLTNGAETILIMTFLLRPIRAVGPLVLAFLLVVALGSQTVLSIAGADPGLLRAISEIGFALGLSATGVFVAMILLGIILFAALGWPLLRWIGRRYERKKLSDQSITIDSMWLLFGIVQSIGLAFEGALWILTGLVAFAAYKLVAALGFRALRRGRATRPRTLLLLRVFRLGKRSERLFDRLRKHWQQVGSISMIAGPDLVTTTVEPHEFLEFVSGRLGRQFVTGSADLERRIAAMDTAADPDRRYRVNEFFCRADTWQATMQRLSELSDAVLMDLRSFSPANQGCLFELGRLLDGVNLERVVFLVDATTDRRFLEAALQRLWQELRAGSPNLESPAPAAGLFGIRNQSEPEIRALLRVLLKDNARTATTG
jgi:hypothetical protein